jgi:hypothetical protein
MRKANSQHLTYKKRDRFAFVPVGTAVKLVRSNMPDGRVLRFIHDPDNGHEAHSVIYGMVSDESRVTALIAGCVTETVLALPPTE